jgi:CRISPR-associated protein Cas5 subtype I-B
MKAIQFEIKGNWAHFRKVEANLNPLSHDFITKTALIGMIGAVLGYEREYMRPLFKQLSEDLIYSVQIKNNLKKQSWGFTYRSLSNALDKAPKQMEIIKDPCYTIVLGLKNERSLVHFDAFLASLKNENAVYEPILGIHNCPAELKFLQEGILEEKKADVFVTKGFVSSKHKPIIDSDNIFRLGFDKIPTFQNDDFWNLPEHYVQVIYPFDNQNLKVEGDYFEFSDKSNWFLV